MHRFTDTSDGDLCVDLPLGEVEPRRRRIVDEPWTWLRLEHGAGVVTVRGPGEHAGATADAAVTATPGCPVSVTTADCAPVLFADPQARVVAAAHAGWQGALNGVVEAALTASVQDAGVDPWDHTLAYAYDDGVFHGYLYAVPDGMGIEFDKNSYLWDEENPISSRYVMCGHDTRVAARLLAENWQQVVSTEDLVIYKRP